MTTNIVSLSGGRPGFDRYAARAFAGGRAIWRSGWTAILGAALIGIFVLIAIFGPMFAPYSPDALHLKHVLAAPGGQFVLGTDELGRDLFSRLLVGARLSLIAGVVVVAVSGVVGLLIGTVAGYVGGVLDEVVMRGTDMVLAFPNLILAMAISAILRPSLTNALIAVGATWWPRYARLVRGETLSLKSRDYVLAARGLGVGTPRILLRHVVPNVISPLIVNATFDVGSVILTVAGLSFIGFGAQPPTAEWGLMISEGANFFGTQWWLAAEPAVALLLLVLGFNLVGDSLRDALDPRGLK
jgi:peptide/nickel transport system permease protein